MRVLILGGDGMLGHALLRGLASGHDVRATLRQPLASYQAFGLFSEKNAVGGVAADDWRRVVEVVSGFAPNAVVNCVGLVKQRPDAKSAMAAIRINALFPHELCSLCEGSARG